MAQGTFGEQIQTTQGEVRLSRTDRVRLEQANQDKINQYNQLKFEAERINQERFQNISSVEQYITEYNKLSDEMKQFFPTPEEIKQQKQDAIARQKLLTDEELIQWQNNLLEEQQGLEKYQDWWLSKDYSYRSENRDRYKTELNERKETIETIQDKINILTSEVSKIEQGYLAQDIINYSERKANYLRDKEDAKEKRNIEIQKNLDAGKIPIYNKKAIVGFLDAETKMPEYLKNKKLLQKADLNYYKDIINWTTKEGIEKLPDWAKNIVNPNFKDVTDFEKKNPTEDILVDNFGNPIGVKSGLYGKSFTIQEYQDYNKKLNEEYQAKLDEQKKIKEESEKNRTYSLDVDFIQREGVPIEMTKGTINTMPQTSTFYSTKEVELKDEFKNPEFKDTMAGKILTDAKDLIVSGWNDSAYYINPIGISPIPTKFDYAKIEVGNNIEKIFDIPLYTSVKKEEYAKSIAEKRKLNDEEMLKQAGITDSLTAKYQNIYQSDFDRLYLDKIMNNEIDFKTAEEQFQTSERAKQIQDAFQYEVGTERNKLSTFSKYSIKGWKYDLWDFGNSLVPTTSGELALEVGAVYGGYKLLKLPYLSNIITGGFAVKGTLDFLNKDISPSARFGGFVTAGVSFASLGYAGYKYATTPEIKTVKIKTRSALTKAEKLDAKQGTIISKIRGKEILSLDDETQVVVTKRTAKLTGETLRSGRRTVVTTKWRDWLGLDPIYKGLPNLDKGTLYKIDGFTYNSANGLSFKTESGYEKAYRLIKDRYGLSDYKVKEILRYRKPISMVDKYVADLYSVPALNGNLPQTYVEGTRTYDKRVININKELGIKTAGGKSIEKIRGNVFQVGKLDKNIFYVGKFDVIKADKIKEFIQITASRQAGIKGYIEATFGKSKYPTSVQITPAQFYKESSFGFKIPENLDEANKPLTFKKNGDVLALKGVDEKLYYERITKGFVNNPPKPKVPKRTINDYTKEDLKSLTNTLKKIFGDGKAEVKTNTFVNVDNLKNQISSKLNPVTSISEQKQISGVVPPSSISLNDKLSDMLISTTETKAIPIPALASKTKLNLIPELDLKLEEQTKQRSGFDLGFDFKTRQGELLKLDQILKVKSGQVPDMAFSDQTLNVNLRPIAPIPNLFEPRLKTPPLIFDFGNENDNKKKLKKKLKKKKLEMFGLLPDFTSRAIGIEPEELNLKDVNKALRNIKTGFEVRSGARIKIPD